MQGRGIQIGRKGLVKRSAKMAKLIIETSLFKGKAVHPGRKVQPLHVIDQQITRLMLVQKSRI